MIKNSKDENIKSEFDIIDDEIDEYIKKYLCSDSDIEDDELDKYIISKHNSQKKINKCKTKEMTIKSSIIAVGACALVGFTKFTYNQLIGENFYSDKLETLQKENNISFYETSNGWYGYVNGNMEDCNYAFEQLRKCARKKNISDEELLLGIASYYRINRPKFNSTINEKISVPREIGMTNEGYQKVKEKK